MFPHCLRLACAESAMQEGMKEVLDLAQGFVPHRTQALHSLHQGRKLLLQRKRGQWKPKWAQCIKVNVRPCGFRGLRKEYRTPKP